MTHKYKLDPSKMNELVKSDRTDAIVCNYITPHGKWQIHSSHYDNLRMLTLSRGGNCIWVNDRDAESVGIRDNDWVEAYNDNGIFVCRAIVSARIPSGVVFAYHSMERTVNVPKAEQRNKIRGGFHNSLTRQRLKPTLMAGGYGQFSLRVQRMGSYTDNQGHERSCKKNEKPGGEVVMDVRAQLSMSFHLDKCIGCHTCSVSCKNVWTSRQGAEYMWWNNVETKPGAGYPLTWEDQDRFKGGWEITGSGALRLKLLKGPRQTEDAGEHILPAESSDDRRLLRALYVRLRQSVQRAGRRRPAGGAPEVPFNGRVHEQDIHRTELGRRHGRIPALRVERPEP